MSRFLIKFLYFIVPLLVIAYPLDLFLSHSLNTNHIPPGEYEIWNDIYTGEMQVEIAIYGSSRAWVQFDSQLLQDHLGLKTYNFGMDGQSFRLQYLRHLEFVQHNPNPDIIILSLDVFSLESMNGLYGRNQFLPYMLGNANLERYTKEMDAFDSWDYRLPLKRYMGRYDALTYLVRDNNTSYRKLGYRGVDHEWNSDFEVAKQQLGSLKIEIDSSHLALMNQFISEVKQANIELIFVYPPEHMLGQLFISNRSQILKLYKNIADKYKVTFLDFSKDELCFNKEMFYNSMHLNLKGSQNFTIKLADRLQIVLDSLTVAAN